MPRNIDLQLLDRRKREILLAVEDWSTERLHFQPSPGDWSAAQTFDHLVRVETGILASAKHGLANPHRLGPRDRIGYWFIDWVFRSDRKVKVPTAASQVLPAASPDFAVILRDWDETRRDLAEFCGQLSPEQQRAGIFRHPVSGWMDLPRIAGFFSVHMVHHQFQLSRITAASIGL